MNSLKLSYNRNHFCNYLISAQKGAGPSRPFASRRPSIRGNFADRAASQISIIILS